MRNHIFLLSKRRSHCRDFFFTIRFPISNFQRQREKKRFLWSVERKCGMCDVLHFESENHSRRERREWRDKSASSPLMVETSIGLMTHPLRCMKDALIWWLNSTATINVELMQANRRRFLFPFRSEIVKRKFRRMHSDRHSAFTRQRWKFSHRRQFEECRRTLMQQTKKKRRKRTQNKLNVRTRTTPSTHSNSESERKKHKTKST